MDFLGAAQYLVVPMILVFWLAPILAGVWALVTLQQIRTMQRATQSKLDSIERLLQRT